MKALALIECPNHVCYRYRVEAFASPLADRQLLLEPVALRKSTPRRVAQFLGTRRAEVVILQRKLLSPWQLGVLRRSAKRLIYDFDDAMFQRDSFCRKGPESDRNLLRFWATLQAADAVIAGNSYLKECASRYVDADRVHLIPTCVEPKFYHPAEHRRTGHSIRLAWIGSSSTLQGLRLAEPCLEGVARRVPGMELRLICDRLIELARVKVHMRPWSSSTEARELANCDIGVSWLPDDDWSRGKCGLKVLQYMSAGLPVVANPVGMNREMVIPGQTGFLASTPQEWAEAVATLASDPSLRQRMGTAGRRLAEERFSVGHWAGRFADIVDSTIDQPAAARSSMAPQELSDAIGHVGSRLGTSQSAH